ncbi:2-iminoacetate synthase ThiH [Morganella morganii]|uniref:2-iminoacetate synthase ThiH n=1 Tax=Morganella morganii TaxID=582 RepID=UPI000A6DF823|nr:2-iminoacetate synthase ThiH [Morganella morganii]
MSEKTFSDRWQQLDWDDLTLQLNSKTTRDVERALSADTLTTTDFMALISPAARPYLEVMAQKAQTLTRQRFGHVVGMYVPLYLSNLCANDCTYCGFSMSNHIKRKTLTPAEIHSECKAIKALGFDSLLLVTGEHQRKVGMDYFRETFPLIRDYFSTMMMEVQPMATEEYAELRTLGLDGVMVYQETYHESTYQRHHLKGKKQDFHWRLQTPDRLGQAGSQQDRARCADRPVRSVADGLLYGRGASALSAPALLENPVIPSLFPRLRPCAGGIEPESLMNEAELVQLICAFRLFAPDIELSLSTRESPYFRDHMVPVAINQVSAGSRTQPGGYAEEDDPELEQFSPHDNRSPQQVADALLAAGLQPVWKDWDKYLGR